MEAHGEEGEKIRVNMRMWRGGRLQKSDKMWNLCVQKVIVEGKIPIYFLAFSNAFSTASIIP